MTKLEASAHQLANKAASGDLKAINSLLSWSQSLKESQQSEAGPALDENDQVTMASILHRLKATASIETVASNSDNSDKEKG
jgi:hypothetical protein